MNQLDSEIVQSIEEPRSNALANTIINMARNLGLRTIAEGVETEGQALELARLGCEFAQGYLFFKPLSAVAMNALAEFEQQPIHIGAAAAVASVSTVAARSSLHAPAADAATTSASADLAPTAGAGSPLPPPAVPDAALPLVSRDEISHLLRPLLSSSNRRG